jgi:ATP-dependent exoDNAse (exonuclease V) beta subunit
LPSEKIDKAVAIQNATVFVRKLNPSDLPSEESAALEEIRYAPSPSPRSESDRQLSRTSPALRYGLWWHDFIQRVPWNQDPDLWNWVFDKQKSISPDPARSLREWKLLLAHLSEPENFRRHFDGDKSIVHTEMPFFWKLDGPSRPGGKCLEGVIDLAFFQQHNGKCLILDWKTDRVPPDDTETLHARYRPQLAAYWKAVTHMTGASVDAGIYSTATGQFIGYDPDELAREWETLSTLPPDKIAAEIAVDPGGPPVQLEFSALSDRARRG